MATRKGRLSMPDNRGYYSRQLGWKQNDQGTRIQHKFRLGTDRPEAERRAERLRQLWEQIDSHAPPGTAVWDDVTLEIARQLAKGQTVLLWDQSQRMNPRRTTHSGFNVFRIGSASCVLSPPMNNATLPELASPQSTCGRLW